MIIVDGEVFLSTSEVASRFGVSPRTILRWHEGKPEEMGAITGINGRMYFRKTVIDETVKRIYFCSATQSAQKNGGRDTGASHRRAVTA